MTDSADDVSSKPNLRNVYVNLGLSASTLQAYQSANARIQKHQLIATKLLGTVNFGLGLQVQATLNEAIKVNTKLQQRSILGTYPHISTLAALAPIRASGIDDVLTTVKKMQLSTYGPISTAALKISNANRPLLDLRLITGSFMTEAIIKQQKLMSNSLFDFTTLTKQLTVYQGLTLSYENTRTKILTDKVLEVNTTDVRVFDNELVTHRQETKLDLLLTTTTDQLAIIANMDERLQDIETLIKNLSDQQQQVFTVNDFKYNSDTSTLSIKSIGKSLSISALRERQLCELLLRNAAAMIKQWTIDDLLEVIGEAYVFSGLNTQGWTDKFYKAALRLNNKLEPMLGFKLIVVDRKTESFYINPLFYHN